MREYVFDTKPHIEADSAINIKRGNYEYNVFRYDGRISYTADRNISRQRVFNHD